MILADKIVHPTQKGRLVSGRTGAAKLNVTRQSVSKWEGAQSIPDMEKILQMSRIFGVTTDFLLKDEMETAEAAPETETAAARRVTMEEAFRVSGITAAGCAQNGAGDAAVRAVPGCAVDAVRQSASKRPALVFPRRLPWAWACAYCWFW